MALHRAKTVAVIALLALAPTAAVTQNVASWTPPAGAKAKAFANADERSMAVSALASIAPQGVAHGLSSGKAFSSGALSLAGGPFGQLRGTGSWSPVPASGSHFSDRGFAALAYGPAASLPRFTAKGAFGGFGNSGGSGNSGGMGPIAGRDPAFGQMELPISLTPVQARVDALPAAAPAAVSIAATAVPEPSTWAMLLIGFAAVGAALRRGARGRAVFARAG